MPNILYAQQINNVDQFSEKVGLDLSISSSEIGLEDEVGDSFDVERDTVAASLNVPVSGNLALYLGAGYIFKSNFKDVSEFDDTGYIVNLGLKNKFIDKGSFQLSGFLNYSHIDETYVDTVVSNGFAAVAALAEADMNEIELGVTGKYLLSDYVDLFLGVSVIPYSDGDAEFAFAGANILGDIAVAAGKTEIERERKRIQIL